jgi:farnesyl diphosphate synthase
MKMKKKLMINSSINQYLADYELFLQDLLNGIEIPAAELKEAMLYALFPGGKRLRPLLVYLCGEIVEVEKTCLDFIAAAIEFTHCYSLIHDDLPAMDNDDFRRGKPSCHKAFNEATAILAGDGLQALAIDILLRYLPSQLSSDRALAVTQELVKSSGPAGMVSGQSLDLSQLSITRVSESELRFIHSLKTGRLILACINMVLATTSSAEEIATALRNYACYLGIAFQMQDDYLDRYAKIDALGKSRASDVANQKFTFANLYCQTELNNLVNQQFQKAKEALTPLKEKANNLLDLTCFLHQRSKIVIAGEDAIILENGWL